MTIAPDAPGPGMAGSPPVHWSTDPGLDVDCLFISAAFTRFQAQAQAKALSTFTLESPGRASACLTLAGASGRWTSPITGAFGGVASHKPAPAAVVFALAEAATAWLRSQSDFIGAQIRLPPDSFPGAGAASLENALFRAGWTLSGVDLNYHLPVVPPAAFAGSLGETKRQILRKLEASGATAGRLRSGQFQRAYQVMADNHAARGFPMTMTWPQMQALAQAFPDRVSFYAVDRGGDMLAAAVCLTVSAGYRYLFNWGEHPSFRAESPTVMLAQALVAACHEAGADVLDFGTATEQSQPNLGLIAFKETLRCAATAKRTYALAAAG